MKINWGSLIISVILVLISILCERIGIGSLETNFFYLQLGALGIFIAIYLCMMLYIVDGHKKIGINDRQIDKMTRGAGSDKQELGKLVAKQNKLTSDVERVQNKINTHMAWGLIGTFLITFATAWGCVWILKVNFYVAYLILGFGHIAVVDKKMFTKYFDGDESVEGYEHGEYNHDDDYDM